MAKETDIKSLGIFGNNSGLAKIREAAEKQKFAEPSLSTSDNAPIKKEIEEKREIQRSNSEKNAKGAGAPIRQFDRVYAAKAPLKLSALLNSTSRNLVEKYETGLSRDELLRKALDEYVKQHLSLEDKQELYHAVLKDLELFRIKYPTIPEMGKNKDVIRTPNEIEGETRNELKKRWGLK